MCFLSVPTPNPSISHSALIAGTEGNLTCGYTLSPSVDTHLMVDTSWMANSSKLATTRDERITISGSTLTFSPLNTSDSGRYTCTLTLSAPQMLYVVQGAVKSSEETTIAVKSRFFNNQVCNWFVIE